MSLLKKIFLTGSLLATVFVMTVPASAWDGRFWKPYQPEQFGGQRRQADGVYGGVEAIYWKIDAPKDIFNKQLSTSDDPTFHIETALAASQVPYDFSLGTRFVIGNRRGHHGWRLGGYGISNFGSVSEPDRWQWNYLDSEYRAGTYYNYMLLTNNYKSYTSRTRVANVDLGWTYRTHPFSWGELEFFVGAKYLDIYDELSFKTAVSRSGEGNTLIYWYRDNVASTTTTTTGSSTNVALNVGETISFEAENRLVAANFGFEVSRRNRRWTFSAAPSLYLGLNTQSFTYSQGSQVEFVPTDEAYNLSENQLHALQFSQNKLQELDKTTFFRRYRTVFAPGGNIQLSAKWQWTDAIAVKIGFDATIMGNIARGSDLVATPMSESSDRYDAGNWSLREVLVLDAAGQPVTVTNASTGVTSFKTETRVVENLKTGDYDYTLRSQGETILMYGISIGLEFRR